MKIWLTTILIFLMVTVNLYGQKYKVGPEDVLEFNFWQRPDLNTTATVSRSGSIILPIIGTIRVKGLTTKEIEELVYDQLSVYNSEITQISVTIQAYNSKKVYVTGQVRNPGKYGFANIPGIWELISEAGGPTESSDLTNVAIISNRKTVSSKETVKTVNLAKSLIENDLSKLPQLKPGDTIFIPARADHVGNFISSGLSGSSQISALSKNSIYVIGEVNRQCAIPYKPLMTLLDAITISGGPKQTAKLNKVQIIREKKGITYVTNVNLKKLFKKKTISPFYLRNGDTIYVPYNRSFKDSVAFDIFQVILTGAATSFLFVYFQNSL